MTFYLVHRDGKALVATDRPLLKAREADRLADAGTLLLRADALEAKARHRRAAVEKQAREEGLATGIEEGRRSFAKAIAEVTRQVEAWRATQERQVAALALAALRKMIDDIGDEAVMEGIARRAVAAISPGDDAQVQVAPELVDTLSAAFAGAENAGQVSVRADPALSAHECRIVTAEGRIIADLSLQLAEIEKRWSLTHVD